MEAVELINSQLDARTILEYYGFQHINETDTTIRACCAVHGGDCPTGFVWNKENNLWFCYTGECNGGDVFTLVEKIEGIDFVNAVKRVAEILSINIQDCEIRKDENRIKKEQLKWLDKQRRKNGLILGLPKYDLPQTKYNEDHITFDRFGKQTREHFSARFCNIFPTETSLLKNKLVIPIKQGLTTVGVALRDTTGIGIPKWLYQPKGLKMAQLLYNFDETKQYEELILVEGIFDVWKYHEIGIDNAIAIFGSCVSEEQYKAIIRTGASVTLSFDNDTAGIKCTKETAKKFMNKTEIKYVQLPEGKDPADCTHNELLSSYLNRTYYVQE